MQENEIELSRAVVTISDVMETYSATLDAEQLEVLPLVAYGMTPGNISKRTGISEAVIRKWIQTNPAFRQAVIDFRKVKDEYHKTMLEQASVFAWSTVFEVLSGIGDEKVKADIAKFVISQLSLKTNKQQIEHKIEPQLHVTEDSAGLIARKLQELQTNTDMIDSEYRLMSDSELVDESAGMEIAKVLDAYQGEDFDAEFKELENPDSPKYIMHPNCRYGELDINEQTKKFRCHMCGAWTRDLVVHIRTEHKLSPARYRKMYGLSDEVKMYLSEPSEATGDEIEAFNSSLEGEG